MCLACTSFIRETVSKVRHLKSLTFYPSISLSTLLYLLLYKENRCHTENLIPTNPHPFICIHTHLSLLLIPQTEFLTRILDLHTFLAGKSLLNGFVLHLPLPSSLAVFSQHLNVFKPVCRSEKTCCCPFFFLSLAKLPGGVARLSSLAHLPFSLNPLQSGLMLITSLNTSILF